MSAIEVGMSRGAAEEVSKAIVQIIDCCAQNHLDSKTIRAAFDAFVHTAEVKNTSISGCTFDCGEKTFLDKTSKQSQNEG